MKNITLSAEENIIGQARQRAAREHTTLNTKFREWIEDYARCRRPSEEAMAAIETLRKKVKLGGRKFTREELNER